MSTVDSIEIVAFACGCHDMYPSSVRCHSVSEFLCDKDGSIVVS